MMSIPLDSYSLSLALEDLLPVIASAIALFILARIVARNEPRFAPLARAGFVLVTAGGASKAAWKLIVALTHHDVAFLERALFGAMGPGFVFIALAFCAATGVGWAARAASGLAGSRAQAIVFLMSFGAAATGARTPELVLLFATVVGSTLLLGRVIRVAWVAGLPVVAAMVTFTLLASFALGAIGAQEQTIALQWAEQLINTCAQVAFAAAAARLARAPMAAEVAA